jgi:opacity protein-like surface antigen
MSDELENGDFDNNGVPDYRQNDGGLETAVSGSGAGSLGIFSVLGLLALLLLRQLRSGAFSVLLCVPVLGVLLSQPAAAAQRCEWDPKRLATADCWYLQAGLGYTWVDPEKRSNGWHTSDDNSNGYKVALGHYFKPKWFAELSYSDLGEAELDNLNPAITGTPTIDYRVAALFAGYQLREPESRWNLYAKVGVSAIFNEADDDRVDYDKQTSVQLALGAGLQWRITRRWFARLEYDAFDNDARFAGLSIGAWFGDPPARH